MNTSALDDDIVFRKRSNLPLMIFLALLVGGVGFIVYRFMTESDPLKVLVVVDFDGRPDEGSKPAARLADRINARLETLGFEPVKLGDPGVVEALESHEDDLRGAATSLRAAFVVRARIEKTIVEHPVGDGYYEVRVVGKINAFHIDDETEGETTQFQSWSGSTDKERGILRLAEGWAAKEAAAHAAALLLAHASIKERLEGDATTIGKLQPAVHFIAARHRELSRAKKAYKMATQRRLDGEKGPTPVKYHGTLAEEIGLCGVGAKGPIIKTEGELVSVNSKGKLARTNTLETVSIMAADGTSSPLWTGYNVYGYPGVSNDGAWVALSEDIFGWAKTVTLVGPKQVKRLVVDPDHRYSSLEPSAHGGAVVGYDRACRRGCPDQLMVRDGATGDERLLWDTEDGTFGGTGWIDDATLLILHTPAVRIGDNADEPKKNPEKDKNAGNSEKVEPDENTAAPTRRFTTARQALWLVETTQPSPEPTLLLEAPVDHSWSWPRVSRDGRSVVVATDTPEGPGLTVIDVATRAATFIPTKRSATAPSFSPDGSQIAFNLYTGSAEIAVVAAAGGAVKQLTKNKYKDLYPRFSADGKRIYFETRGRDPNFPKRHVSLLASVAAP